MIRSCVVVVTRSIAVGAALVALVAFTPGRAAAHALVDEGRRLYEEADFVASLDVLGRAAAGDDLSVDDLADLFEVRALVHLAMGNGEQMREDLRRLAAIRPEHALPAVAPPDVVSAFAELRTASSGSPRLTASTESTALGVTVTVRLENDPLSLVREVRISGRTTGGAWERATDAPLFVPTPAREIVEYYAEAIGPGGAVIASSGRAGEPLRAAPVVVAETGGGGLEAWPFIVAGAGVVVAVVVIVTVVVVTGEGSNETDVAPFTIRF